MENEFSMQENWILIEPVFEDKPLGESSWGNLVEMIQQVNRLKAQLLATLYEETRTAYQKYKMIRDQAIADYAQQRTEDAAEEIREDIEQLLREEFRETLLAIGRAMVEPTDEPAPLTDVAVHEASRIWARYYVCFLDVLTQALQECNDGNELAQSTRRLMNEVTRTYLQEA